MLEVKCVFCPARNVFTDDCLRSYVFKQYYSYEYRFRSCEERIKDCIARDYELKSYDRLEYEHNCYD